MTVLWNTHGRVVLALGTTILIVAGGVCWTNAGWANCSDDLPTEVTVLPDDGAIVPSDIENLYVYHSYTRATVKVVSAGETFPIVDRLASLPNNLEPGHVFEYEVVAELDASASSEDDETTRTFGPFSFTVGDAPAPTALEPSGSFRFLEGTFCGERAASSASCAVESQRPVVNGCFDTGIAWYFGLDVDPQDEVELFRVSANGIAAFDTPGCAHVMGVPHLGEDLGAMACGITNCVNIIPLDRAMRLRVDLSTSICEPGGAAEADDSAVACSLTVMGSRRDSMCFAVGASVLAVVGILARWRKRARTARKKGGSPTRLA